LPFDGVETRLCYVKCQLPRTLHCPQFVGLRVQGCDPRGSWQLTPFCCGETPQLRAHVALGVRDGLIDSRIARLQ
jgi:hypothetical protein